MASATQTTTAQPKSWGLAQQVGFAADVQRALGLIPTVQGTALLVGWGRREGTGSALASDWNPLATTLSSPGARNLPGNSAGVKLYPTRQAGVAATAATLKNYPNIVSYLRGSSTDVNALDADLRKWSSGGYGASGIAPYASAAQNEIIASPAAHAAINFGFSGLQQGAAIARGRGGLLDPLGSAIETAAGGVADAAGGVVSAAEAIPNFLGKVGTVLGFIFSMRGVYFLFGLMSLALGVIVLIKTTTGVTPGPPQAMAVQAAAKAAE